MQKALGTALAGLVLGAIVVPLAIGAFAPLGFLIFAAFAGLAGLRQESRGFGGGLLIALGSWWVYFVGRCRTMRRVESTARSKLRDLRH